ncbi:MAG: hypothetical protein LBG60_01135 [Bifidobacteriaceae bacterium]|nr:hypothetical protein [Bifidobacteriaceae bacterium]
MIGAVGTFAALAVAAAAVWWVVPGLRGSKDEGPERPPGAVGSEDPTDSGSERARDPDAGTTAALFTRAFGGGRNDWFNAAAVTLDGDYVAAGQTYSDDGDFPPRHGDVDALLARFDAGGDQLWAKTLGGSSADAFNTLMATADGGFIAAGYTYSDDGDFPRSRGEEDAVVARFDATGEMEWAKTLGGEGPDMFNALAETEDGGFIAVGETHSFSGDFPPSKNAGDALLARFDPTGELLWAKTLGGNDFDSLSAVAMTADGGYMTAGATLSVDGDFPVTEDVGYALLARFDATGEMLWAETLGGSDVDTLSGLVVTADGGCVAVGMTSSVDGDFPAAEGGTDALVAGFDAAGERLWAKTLGGTGPDGFASLAAIADGGYIVVGQTASQDGDFAASRGGGDAVLAKLTEAGEMLWSKTLGGTSVDGFSAVAVTADGGYLAAGLTNSDDGDFPRTGGEVGFEATATDAVLARFGPDGEL